MVKGGSGGGGARTPGAPRADLPAEGVHMDALTGALWWGDGEATWRQVGEAVHAARHVTGGADAIKLDDLATPDDNADLNVSTTRHGLVPKLANDPAKFLNGVGAWAVPVSGGGVLVYANATPSMITNTAAETAFAQAYTIPANRLAVGSVVRAKLFGVYSTATPVTPTLRIRAFLNGVAMIGTGTMVTVAGVSTRGWSVDLLFICVTAGAGGTIEAQGFAQFSTALTTDLSANLASGVAFSLDTTVAQELTVAATWSIADASIVTLRQMIVEVM